MDAEKVLGCLWGGALGDALGAPFEGRSGTVVPDFSSLKELHITDDTQLTLATCEAIVATRGADPESIAIRMTEWFRAKRITGIGASTFKALRELSMGAHWGLCGAQGEMAAGNGAAMRIAPLAFVLDPAKKADRTVIRDVSRITHKNEEAYVGALAVIYAIQYAMAPEYGGNSGLKDHVVGHIPDSKLRDRLTALPMLTDNVPIESVCRKFGNSGYVVDSVSTAIYCAECIEKSSFIEIMGSIASSGGDTDTIAAISGQILGAHVGYGALPSEYLDKIKVHEVIFSGFNQFSDFLLNRSCSQ